MIVAILALVMAMVGTGVAASALTKRQKKQVNNIVNGALTARAPGLSVRHARSADTAAEASSLGAVAASGYQRSCKAGAIKGSVVANTAGFTSSTFQNVAGFNCFRPGNTTTSVQMKRSTQGVYVVRFVGNSGADNSGSAVCSSLGGGFTVECESQPGGADAPGEVVFLVQILDASVTGVDGSSFALLAY